MSGAKPYLGHGVGLRVPHYAHLLEHPAQVDWFEAITENFFGDGGRPAAVLDRVASQVPVVFHGVSLAIGSVEPPPQDYLARVETLLRRYDAPWFSDHLCWGRVRNGEAVHHTHDLLPLPYTEEALAMVTGRVAAVQERMGRPMALENVSSYVSFAESQLSEAAFLAEVATRSGCKILLDLNNIIVSAKNHGFSPSEYLAQIPAGSVIQFHLANHDNRGTHKFDSHKGPVPTEVWELYEQALRRFGPVSSLVEWDEDIPPWDVLLAEQRQAARRAQEVLGA